MLNCLQLLRRNPMSKFITTVLALLALIAFCRFANRQLIREEAGECDRWATYPGFQPGEYCHGAWQARAEIDGNK